MGRRSGLRRSGRTGLPRSAAAAQAHTVALAEARPGEAPAAAGAAVPVAGQGHRLRRRVRPVAAARRAAGAAGGRSEEHTSELQSLMRISYAVFCLTKKTERFKPD